MQTQMTSESQPARDGISSVLRHSMYRLQHTQHWPSGHYQTWGASPPHCLLSCRACRRHRGRSSLRRLSRARYHPPALRTLAKRSPAEIPYQTSI
eukprot:scaffold551_cov395-Prasinococcus_capsulatus_cf.AAC.13